MRRGNDEAQQADQGGGAPRERLRRQHDRGEQQGNPRARPPPLGAALRRGGAFVRRHEIAHRAGLIGQLGGDDRALRGVGDRAEHVVAPARLDRIPRLILLPHHQLPAIVADRNPDRLAATLGHKNQMDAEARQPPRFLDRPLQRVVRFTVGEHDQDAIGDFRAGVQQVDPLLQRRYQRRPALRRDVRIERVEIQRQRRAIHRQRGEDVARPGERGEAEPVAVEILHETARFPQRPAQPARLDVFGQHGPRDVDGEHEIEAPRLGDDPLLSPARSRQRNGGEPRGQAERRRAEPSRRAGDAPGRLRPGGRAPEPRTPRPRGGGPYRPSHDRCQGEDDRRVEGDHGTRTANVAARTSSSANASNPMPSGTRYASS